MSEKLQNNFTTPEQSKRLLELGVPEWTCDCCYHAKCEDFINWVVKDQPQVMPAPFSKVRSGYKSWDNMPIVPCWSIGRLIEIAIKCYIGTPEIIFGKLHSDDVVVQKKDYDEGIGDAFVRFYEESIIHKRWDFSKLKE